MTESVVERNEERETSSPSVARCCVRVASRGVLIRSGMSTVMPAMDVTTGPAATASTTVTAVVADRKPRPPQPPAADVEALRARQECRGGISWIRIEQTDKL
jgi:hypothetical protein